MSKVLAVAWREFKATALTKAFLIAAVFVPVLIICLGILGPMLFNPAPPPLKGVIAVIDPEGRFAAAARVEFDPQQIAERIRRITREQAEELSTPQTDLSLQETSQHAAAMSRMIRPFDIHLELDDRHVAADLDGLKLQVQDGRLVAVATTFEVRSESAPPGDGSAVRLYVPSNMNVKHTALIEDVVQAATGRARILAAGLDVEKVRGLARAPDPTTIRISRDGEEKAEGRAAKAFKMLVPMAFMMLIWMGAFVSANQLLTTTIEEKANKVMEVLLSAVSPIQLMTGKIIGQAFVGLLMVGMYLSMGIAALVGFAMLDLVEWTSLMYFALYYIMAYFMISSMMAAIGSAVNELREAQSLVTPAMLVLMIPLMLWLPISDSPNGMLATITSFIPPLIPFVMILRVTGGEPIPGWQIIASLAIGYPAMIGMIWMAAKIFRVGVLMTGKPPTPMELLRWIRYA